MSTCRLVFAVAILAGITTFASAAPGETAGKGTGDVPAPETRPVVTDGAAEQNQDC